MNQSLARASEGCNSAILAMSTEHGLQWADFGLIALGVLVTFVAILRWRSAATSPPSAMGIANEPPIIPPEALFLPVAAYLAVMLASYPIFARLLGTEVATHDHDATGANSLDFAAILAGNLAFVGGAAASLAIGARFEKGSALRWVSGRRPIVPQLLSGVLGGVSAVALCQLTLFATMAVVSWLNPEVAFPEHGVIDALRDPECPSWLPGVLWLGVIGVTPIAEEMYFRGMLQPALGRALRSRVAGVLLTAILFGLAHASQPQVVPALTVFGLIVGVLYLRTGSLIGPITAHAFFNAKTLVWEALLAHSPHT